MYYSPHCWIGIFESAPTHNSRFDAKFWGASPVVWIAIASSLSLSELVPEDFKQLSELSEGYSGNDIEVVVQDALLQPIKKNETAEYFKLVSQLVSAARVTSF